MKREAGGPCLSAVFVDYDNIYLSLKRKSEEAAKRFAKDAGPWLREIESGRLITPTNAQFGNTPAPHRHEPLLRQSGAAAQPARQLHRHELVPVRAPPLPARRVRGDRLPAADRAAQELRRHPHGHGYPRPADARHLLRRVHHPVGRCRLHARADPPAGACAPHGDLRQRLHRGALHGHQRRRDPRSQPDRADPGRRAAVRTAPTSCRPRRRRIASRMRGARSWPRSSPACAPRLRRCRSRRWPTVRCARSVTRRPSPPAGPAPAASASCCAAACPTKSA